jgi:predicted Zn-dependent peptidase
MLPPLSARALLRPATAAASAIRRASTQPTGPVTRVTTLPNRVRVTTEASPGHFHAVGVYVDAGSRFESHRTSGASHLLDRLAFKVSVLGAQVMSLRCAALRCTKRGGRSSFRGVLWTLASWR